MNVEEVRRLVQPACRLFEVRRLDLFGSMTRASETQESDVDLLVEFSDPDRKPARRFFGLLHRLEDDIGRKVDLLTVDGLRNPHFRSRVMTERIPVYER